MRCAFHGFVLLKPRQEWPAIAPGWRRAHRKVELHQRVSGCYHCGMNRRGSSAQWMSDQQGPRLEGLRLPAWTDVPTLLAELQWLRAWTRRLEAENQRLRRLHSSRFGV